MRILHIIPAQFGSGGVVGGAERYALELARNMAEQTPTTLLTFGDRDSEEKIGALKIRVSGSPWYVRGQRTNPLSLSILPAVLAADVVHCHQQHIAASSLAALICRLTGRKVFVSDLGGGGWDISGYISTDRWYHGHLHISQYSRFVSGQTDHLRARVIYGGVDISKFSPDPSVPKNGNVLFVGRLLPHKGVDDLVKAVPNDMNLTIIGQPYDQRFFEELKILARGKRVTFHHDCDDAALVDAYRRALCVVLPSVYRTASGQESKVPELLGQTLLEGMACGTPAICTNVASMPELVEDGVTGLVVPPNSPDALRDAISSLRTHANQTQRMGEASRLRVLERFTWPAVVQRCLDIYRGLTGTE